MNLKLSEEELLELELMGYAFDETHPTRRDQTLCKVHDGDHSIFISSSPRPNIFSVWTQTRFKIKTVEKNRSDLIRYVRDFEKNYFPK